MASLEEIVSSLHSLSAIIAPEEFKSYDELKEKFDRVLGLTGATATSTAESIAEDLDEVPWSDVNKEPVAEEPVIQSADSSDSEDAMDYFKKLASDS